MSAMCSRCNSVSDANGSASVEASDASFVAMGNLPQQALERLPELDDFTALGMQRLVHAEKLKHGVAKETIEKGPYRRRHGRRRRHGKCLLELRRMLSERFRPIRRRIARGDGPDLAP